MSCSNSAITMCKFDAAALQNHFEQHSEEDLEMVFWQFGRMGLDTWF